MKLNVWPDLIEQKQQILHISKTSRKIIEFPFSAYDIEVAIKNGEPVVSYVWMQPACLKRFTKPQNFVVHLKTHYDIKEFSCSFCSKTFTQKGNMMKHVRKHMVSDINERRTVHCLFCKSLFTEKYNCQVRSYLVLFHLLKYQKTLFSSRFRVHIINSSTLRILVFL